jgi:hypothetical protein
MPGYVAVLNRLLQPYNEKSKPPYAAALAKSVGA